MSKKKLEIVELNKKEEKIILEQEQSAWILFWKKYGKLLLSILLILSVTILIIGLFIAVSNLSSTETPTIKEVSIDTNLDVSTGNIIVDSSSLTEETAKNTFNKNSIFKKSGEVLITKTIETGQWKIKFFSDYTALKINKKTNIITRINALNDKTYGIDEKGVINTKVKTSDVTETNTKKYPWGTVIYYSDGSAEIIDSKIDMFVRNAKDINENYISNNKVTYLKEIKNIGNIKLNYYYDGTIEVIKNNKSYLVRNESDLNITSNEVTFKNNNEATIKETKKLSDGKIIEYYTDGGAIIKDGSRTLSVRKSNSIIIKNNKIFEIVDNIYVTISKTSDDGNVIYYTNGSAVIKDYNGEKIYIEENSNIKYSVNSKTTVEGNYEKLTDERNIGNDKITNFEKTAIVETNEYIAIIPKDNILYNSDGSLKEILTNEVDLEDKPIKITNNTNETISYRVVIEKSEKTNLDVQYMRYQLSVGDIYIEPTRLDSKIWTNDKISSGLSVEGTNYILLEKTLEPFMTDEIRVMFWTDYDTIPNSMQDKYFYGTIKIYAWQEIDK